MQIFRVSYKTTVKQKLNSEKWDVQHLSTFFSFSLFGVQSLELERRGKRKRKTLFLERTREGHRQSDEPWNRFKGNVGETSERRDGAHMGFSERV